jgi:hypothetical protein
LSTNYIIGSVKPELCSLISSGSLPDNSNNVVVQPAVHQSHQETLYIPPSYSPLLKHGLLNLTILSERNILTIISFGYIRIGLCMTFSKKRLVYDLMQQSKSYKKLQPASTMMCAMQEKTRIYTLRMVKRIIFVIDGHKVVDTF